MAQKKTKVDLRKGKFRDSQVLMARELNDLWKDIEKLKRKLNK